MNKKNREFLRDISDEELERRLNAVRASIRRTRDNNGDARLSEIDLCYLEREQENRDFTYELSQRYSSSFKEETKSYYQYDRMEEEEAIRQWLEYSRENEKFINV